MPISRKAPFPPRTGGPIAEFRALLFVPLLLATLARGDACAQATEPEGTWAYGYGFVGFGAALGEELGDPIFHLGSGADVMFGRFGLTGELGYMAGAEFALDGFGTFSPGVLYAFARHGTVPFISGGFTLFFRGAGEAGWFVGAGVNFWRSDRFGFRAELNDEVLYSNHLLAARFAILFR